MREEATEPGRGKFQLSIGVSILRTVCPALIFWRKTELALGFPGGSDGKESACNAGDPCSITRSGRSPGEGNGNPLQYSCLENSMDRGVQQAIVHQVAKSWTWLRVMHSGLALARLSAHWLNTALCSRYSYSHLLLGKLMLREIK